MIGRKGFFHLSHPIEGAKKMGFEQSEAKQLQTLPLAKTYERRRNIDAYLSKQQISETNPQFWFDSTNDTREGQKVEYQPSWTGQWMSKYYCFRGENSIAFIGFEEAAGWFSKAIEANPRNVEAYLKKAFVCSILTNNPELASTYYQELANTYEAACKQEIERLEIFGPAAAAYIHHEDWAKALGTCEAAIGSEERRGEFCRTAGHYQKDKTTENALSSHRKLNAIKNIEHALTTLADIQCEPAKVEKLQDRLKKLINKATNQVKAVQLEQRTNGSPLADIV